jgi:hypothetical protein
MIRSIEFNSHSQKYEVHEAEKREHFVVVGKPLSEHDSRQEAEEAAAKKPARYLPSRHPHRKA